MTTQPTTPRGDPAGETMQTRDPSDFLAVGTQNQEPPRPDALGEFTMQDGQLTGSTLKPGLTGRFTIIPAAPAVAPVGGLDLRAIDALTNHQRQLDECGSEVGVSRQALDEVLAALAAPAVAPASAVGDLIPGEHDLHAAVHSLHETGVFRDDEGEATDRLEKLLTWVEKYNAALAAPSDAQSTFASVLATCCHGYPGCTEHGAHEHFAGPSFADAQPAQAVTDAMVEAAMDAWFAEIDGPETDNALMKSMRRSIEAAERARSAQVEDETPCPVCGCEVRTAAGYLQCECPAPSAGNSAEAVAYAHIDAAGIIASLHRYPTAGIPAGCKEIPLYAKPAQDGAGMFTQDHFRTALRNSYPMLKGIHVDVVEAVAAVFARNLAGALAAGRAETWTKCKVIVTHADRATDEIEFYVSGACPCAAFNGLRKRAEDAEHEVEVLRQHCSLSDVAFADQFLRDEKEPPK